MNINTAVLPVSYHVNVELKLLFSVLELEYKNTLLYFGIKTFESKNFVKKSKSIKKFFVDTRL
jgi:hypothetical protein